MTDDEKDAMCRERNRKRDTAELRIDIEYIIYNYMNGHDSEIVTFDHEPPPLRRVQLYAEELERRNARK